MLGIQDPLIIKTQHEWYLHNILCNQLARQSNKKEEEADSYSHTSHLRSSVYGVFLQNALKCDLFQSTKGGMTLPKKQPIGIGETRLS